MPSSSPLPSLPPLASLAQLLNEEELIHLVPLLTSFGLAECATAIVASRPSFLARLKAAGVSKLSERQAITNAVAWAHRDKRIPLEATADDAAAFSIKVLKA